MKRILHFLLLLSLFTNWAEAQQSKNFLSFHNVEELQRFLSYNSHRIPLVSAHRGGPAKGFPENAIETFSNSLQHQPLIVECDIVLSKDSVLVMMHDHTLERTTTGKGPVSNYTLQELRQFRLKDPAGDTTPFRIPTLDEVLE